MQYYYFGEFGYFNFCVLGRLGTLPQAKVELLTFPDYARLIEIAYPGRFSFARREVPHYDRSRKFHGSGGPELHQQLEAEGFHDLRTALHLRDRREQFPPAAPLTAPEPWKGARDLVSVCCRQRAHLPQMNLQLESWSRILASVAQVFPSTTIAFHGLAEETSSPPAPRSVWVPTIDESIAILNVSRILITSMSGFAQFAANCGCHVLQIGPAHKWFHYAPFGSACLHLDPDRLHELPALLHALPSGKA